MKKLRWILLAGIICLSLTGCSGGSNDDTDTSDATEDTEESDDGEEDADSDDEEVESATAELYAMTTYMTITAYGDNAQDAVDAASEEIERLDALFSTGDEGSEVYAINENGSGILSEDGQYLMECSLDLYESTGGVFDIAIYPIMDAWGFTTENYTVPDDETLSELLELTDASNIIYDGDTGDVSFELDGMAIDFGGIAKGYTSQNVAEIFREYGIESGMINLGGNVYLVGAKTDGSLWRVGVQSPDDTVDMLGVIEAEDTAIITSGGYERYFEEDGVSYHHIIDPSTGYPANNGLISVSIVCEDGTMADGLSTSLYIMGLEDAVAYWQEHSDEFDTILLTEDWELYVTEGIADSYTSDLEVHVIEAGSGTDGLSDPESDDSGESEDLSEEGESGEAGDAFGTEDATETDDTAEEG